jgi:hypothetical protein
MMFVRGAFISTYLNNRGQMLDQIPNSTTIKILRSINLRQTNNIDNNKKDQEERRQFICEPAMVNVGLQHRCDFSNKVKDSMIFPYITLTMWSASAWHNNECKDEVAKKSVMLVDYKQNPGRLEESHKLSDYKQQHRWIKGRCYCLARSRGYRHQMKRTKDKCYCLARSRGYRHQIGGLRRTFYCLNHVNKTYLIRANDKCEANFTLDDEG